MSRGQFVSACRVVLPHDVQDKTVIALIGVVLCETRIKHEICEDGVSWEYDIEYRVPNAEECPQYLFLQRDDFVSDDWNRMKFYEFVGTVDGEYVLIEPTDNQPE